MMIETLFDIGISNFIIGAITAIAMFIYLSLEVEDDLYFICILSFLSYMIGFFWFILFPIFSIVALVIYLTKRLHKFIRKFKRN